MEAGQNGQAGLLVRNLARTAEKAFTDLRISLERPAKGPVLIPLRHMEETNAKAKKMTWICATCQPHAVSFNNKQPNLQNKY